MDAAEGRALGHSWLAVAQGLALHPAGATSCIQSQGKPPILLNGMRHFWMMRFELHIEATKI